MSWFISSPVSAVKSDTPHSPKKLRRAPVSKYAGPTRRGAHPLDPGRRGLHDRRGVRQPSPGDYPVVTVPGCDAGVRAGSGPR